MDITRLYEENKTVLNRMKSSGDTLLEARRIDFSVVFATKDGANKFVSLLSSNKNISVGAPRPYSKGIWDVTVAKYMTPTVEHISETEIFLSRIALPLGGRNDGWGCFASL